MTLLLNPGSNASGAADSAGICRVVLIDGQQIFRQALRALLAAEPGLTVVGEAGRLAEALELVGSQSPDVVLCDVKLPDCPGIQLIPQLRVRCPQSAFIALTALHARDHIAAARKAGVLAYLSKQSGRAQLLTAIREVSAGRRYRCDLPSARPAADAGSHLTSGAAHLTERQRQVLRSVALGHGAREIAETLGVSVKAVYKQRERLRETLQLNSTAALTRFAVYEGFAEDGPARR
jgi:DNA-binding NarL/FixJ family response regulator